MATAGGLSQDGRRRRSPLAAAASHERRRGTLHKHWACPGWPSWMGTAAAGRRTDGGRWGEATRSLTAIRLKLGSKHYADKTRRAFVFESHSFAFARQVAFTSASRLPCNDHGRWPSAPSGGWRGGEADRPTRCRAGEVEQAFAELSRVAERLAEERADQGSGGSFLHFSIGCVRRSWPPKTEDWPS